MGRDIQRQREKENDEEGRREKEEDRETHRERKRTMGRDTERPLIQSPFNIFSYMSRLVIVSESIQT